MKRRWQICENHVYLYFTCYMVFSSTFLHVAIILRVFHFGVIKRQIELKQKVKTEVPLSMAIMLNHPWQSLYTE